MGSWDILHINLMEDMREELHTMVVIDSHKLIILLLIDFMRDRFSVDDCSHAEECITLCILLLFSLLITNRLNFDVINSDFSAVLTFTKPTLVLVYLVKRLTIDMGNVSVFGLLLYGT